jgi:flagellar biosynthetic protein FlhB
VAEGSGGERTEKATPKKREEARKKGQVARSQEVNGFFVLLCGITGLLLSGGHLVHHLGRNASYLFGQIHVLRVGDLSGVQALVEGNLEVLLSALGPLAGALLLVGLGANILQVGLRLSPEIFNLNLEKINPINGMKRFVSRRTWFELFKNLLKIGLITLVAWVTIRGLMGDLIGTPLLALDGVTATGRFSFAKLMYKLLALMALLALLDWVFQKYDHERKLKMSKQELKQEFKDMEGDPQVKARIRHIQMETARRRMLTDVPRADVVVTNPTHYAVALRYEQGEPAPRVLAKGRDHLAETIKRIARGARVPVIENRPVARALYRQVKVGGMVPEDLFQVVAEILAYVYRLKRA